MRITNFGEVVGFLRQRYLANDFDPSLFIEDDVIGVNISNFGANFLEVLAQGDQNEKEVPDLGFLIGFIDFIAIKNFFPQ